MERTVIKPARVVDGVVEIQDGEQWYKASDAVIIGQGEADSTGFVVISPGAAKYLSNTQIDTAFLVQQVIDLLTQAAAITRAQYVIGADNAVFGQNTALTPIGEQLDAIKNKLVEYKLI